ncbi:uncharacterized protein LOC143715951 [Siphateles boraxobius]|uniref:uncharacterized protein LOC143715951 n=1 Tax=Siphateles boraxobius TaxID=180520 RepID=UPI004062D76F
MTARVYCSLSAVLMCLSACLSTTDAGSFGFIQPEEDRFQMSGQCPAKLKVVPSRRGCSCDRDCSVGHKCCQFPRGPACVLPVFTKPGECPSTPPEAGECAQLCDYDSDCPNNEKCCSNGRVRQCMDQYTVMPTAEPAAEPPKPAAEPPKPAAEPPKPAAEPPKPAAEPLSAQVVPH